MARGAKLTETKIIKAEVPDGKPQVFLWDSLVSGFGLRALASGSKTFWFQYRPGGGRGSSRMVRIGPWPAVRLAAARSAARDLAGSVARGKDPAAEKQKERRRSSSSLRALLAENGEYERSLKRRHLVKTAMVMSGLRRGLGNLMSKDIAAITRNDFISAITAIEDKGKLGAADDLRKFARTFCEWAVLHEYAPANVLAGLRRSKQTRAEKLASEARAARALSDAEIVALWNACESRGVFGNILRLLLLTGARRGEIAKLTHDRVLSDRLVLPPGHTKMGEKHEIPLTTLMRTVIAAQPATASPLVFPATKSGGVISGWTKALNAIRRAAGARFTPHDLRRTCRTLMSRLGIDRDTAELAIGHKRQGLEAIYNLDEAWELRCGAFAKVSNHITMLTRASAKVDEEVPV
jgi:integrase